MMHRGSRIGQCMRLFWLLASLFCASAFADAYDPVNRLLQDGQLTQAMAQADAYLAKNPRDPQMRFLKALIQQDGGQRDAAIASYTALTQEYPELPEPYNNLAVLLAGQGKLEQAREALEMAIRNSRSYATAYENLGDVHARLAEQSYRQALQFDAANTALAPKLTLIRQLIGTPTASRPDPVPSPKPAPAGAASRRK